MTNYTGKRYIVFVLLLLIFPSCTLKGESPLHKACSKGDISSIKQLLKNGDINEADHQGMTPLMIASENGHIKVVKYLLKNGASVNLKNNFGESALMIAAQKDNVNIVKLLLKRGGNPNFADIKGWTALMLSKSAAVTGALIKKGAEVNYSIPNSGITPLMVAAEEGNVDIVITLLKAGADKNKSDASNKKAIDYAAKGEQSEVLKLLIK